MPAKIHFLRKAPINLIEPNLDILPEFIIRQLNLAPENKIISIDKIKTNQLVQERNKSLPLENIDIIFTADSQRCRKTAETIKHFVENRYEKKVEVLKFHFLGEVQMRVDKIIPNFTVNYKTLTQVVIDTAIFKAILEKRWSEPIDQIMWRLDYIFEVIKKHKDKNNILIISHIYFSRFAELYIKNKGNITNITLKQLLETDALTPLNGFTTDTDLKYFQSLPKIETNLPITKTIPSLTETQKEHTDQEPDINNHKHKTGDVFILRHSKLNLPYENHNSIPSGLIRDLSQSSLDPKIDKWYTEDLIKRLDKQIPFDSINIIFSASSSRSQDTAEMLQSYILRTYEKKVDLLTFPYLNEIRFNINKIYPEPVKEFESMDIDLLNTHVLKAMVSGTNCESMRECYWRTDYLVEILNKYDNKKKMLIITHDYYMRAIELYLKGKRLHTITEDDCLKPKGYNYLDGFSTSMNFDTYIPLQTY